MRTRYLFALLISVIIIVGCKKESVVGNNSITKDNVLIANGNADNSIVTNDTVSVEGFVGFIELSNPPGSNPPLPTGITLNNLNWVTGTPQNPPSWIYINGSVSQSDANSARHVRINGTISILNCSAGKYLKVTITQIQTIP
jgi:hypothetical protein